MDKLDPQFVIDGTNGLTILDFWTWAYSDILSNRNRGIFAEFLVGTALEVVKSPRVEWSGFDLRYRDKRIEVKSSGYCQSWQQTRLSPISFGIAETHTPDDNLKPNPSGRVRSSDCYVFCLYNEKDIAKAWENLLNIAYWDFYVISTEKLNTTFARQKTLSLSRLAPYCKAVPYLELKSAVDVVLGLQ